MNIPEGQKPLKFSMQEIIGEKNVRRIENTPVETIGVGVIGHRVATSLLDKGYPQVVVDPDTIEAHNLTVQRFPKHELGEFKVRAIGKAMHGRLAIQSQLITIPMTFQETVSRKLPINPAIVTCQTHDWGSRMEVGYHFYPTTPVVFSGIAATANAGWVFVQEPGKACLRCSFPEVEVSGVAPCGGMCGDIADVIAGIVSYAVDTLAIDHPDRKRSWNLYLIELTGYAPRMHQQVLIERNPRCELCHSFK